MNSTTGKDVTSEMMAKIRAQVPELLVLGIYRRILKPSNGIGPREMAGA